MLRSHAEQSRAAARRSLQPAARGERSLDRVSDLYRDLGDPVYRYLAARLGHGADAEDATALTFVAVLEQLRGFRGESTYRTWVFAIARRKALDVLRLRRRAKTLASVTQEASMDVETDAVARIRIREVIEALGQIRWDRAEAIRLRIFGGLSVAETAQVLGRSEAAVKMLVHRGLADIRERLREEPPDEQRR